MDRAVVRRQMIEVVRAARETLRDDANAAHLWGRTSELCETLERDAHGDTETVMIAALREDIRAGVRSTAELAEEIVWFVRAIEHDLVDEQREAIVDEVVCCRGQTDG